MEVLTRTQQDEIRRHQAEKIARETAAEEEKRDRDPESVAKTKIELEELRTKLSQALKSQSLLENMLAKAEERNETLEQELGNY